MNPPNWLKILLEYVIKHGDSIESVAAQREFDALFPMPQPEELPEIQAPPSVHEGKAGSAVAPPSVDEETDDTPVVTGEASSQG